MQKTLTIVWFRQDLRILDNPALAVWHEQILPIYIWDATLPIGSSSKVWLYYSLEQLQQSLGNKLNLYIGTAKEIITLLIKRYKVNSIFWNTCYEPWHIDQEHIVKNICQQHAIKWQAFNGNYLWHPEEVVKNDGSYYKVFTAYQNKAFTLAPRTMIKMPNKLSLIKDNINETVLSDLALLSDKQWEQQLKKAWAIGEMAAHKKLAIFVKKRLAGYGANRNYLAQKATSLLAPHLHFGEISPAQVLQALNFDKGSFVKELLWREFASYLLYNFKAFATENFNSKFNKFAWVNNPVWLRAWQTGNTGYPLIDAGMRELWHTGYMHNRARMVTASFLVKNLNIHWQQGQAWFWDCLVDADLASNSVNWQWVAGCGVDAAPYLRIFNPILQGAKFDSAGNYTRRFVPELQDLPNQYLFKPWTAPEYALKAAHVILGKTYPRPIVDFMSTRKSALARYRKIR